MVVAVFIRIVSISRLFLFGVLHVQSRLRPFPSLFLAAWADRGGSAKQHLSGLSLGSKFGRLYVVASVIRLGLSAMGTLKG